MKYWWTDAIGATAMCALLLLVAWMLGLELPLFAMIFLVWQSIYLGIRLDRLIK